MTSVLYP